jgi:methylase of polypeptide subunit release factors
MWLFAFSNWLEIVDDNPELSFDLIVCNPPYISDQEFLSLETTVREFS